MWASLVNSDLYVDWEGHGIIGAAESCFFFNNISCFDTSPGLAWLRNQWK